MNFSPGTPRLVTWTTPRESTWRKTVAGRSSLAYPAVGHPRGSPDPSALTHRGPDPDGTPPSATFERRCFCSYAPTSSQTTPLHGGHFTDKEKALM